jgi:hypothetical protein
MFLKIAPSKNFQTIVLKLLHDALLISVVLFFGLLIIESVLPGLVSGHLGLGIVAGLILITLGLINYFSEKLAIINSLKEVGVNKKEVFIILLVFFIFIFNGVLRIDWLLGVIISLLASLAGLLVFFFIQRSD